MLNENEKAIGLAVFFAVSLVSMILWRIAVALENIAAILKAGTVRVEDVDRAKVYAEHLGGKLKT